MAMLMAWQTGNAARSPNSKQFARGFMIVASGMTIRDRLRVLLPNDPESHSRTREILPSEIVPAMDKAKIVITNFRAFKLHEKPTLAAGTRQTL